MRIAIYSRGIESNQRHDFNMLLEELARHNVEPVFFQDFFNQFYSAVDIKAKYSTFNSSADLDETIDCNKTSDWLFSMSWFNVLTVCAEL